MLKNEQTLLVEVTYDGLALLWATTLLMFVVTADALRILLLGERNKFENFIDVK